MQSSHPFTLIQSLISITDTGVSVTGTGCNTGDEVGDIFGITNGSDTSVLNGKKLVGVL